MLAHNEMERLSKLHLARRRSSVCGVHSPAPSPPDGSQKMQHGGGSDSSTLEMRSPLDSGRGKKEQNTTSGGSREQAGERGSKGPESNRIFEPEGDSEPLRTTRTHKVLTFDPSLAEKTVGKKSTARRGRSKKKGEQSKEPRLTPAQQYLQDFIKDSKQKIK